MSVPRGAHVYHSPTTASLWAWVPGAPGVATEQPDPACVLLPSGLGQAPSRLSGLSVPCPLPSPQAGTLTCELKNCPYCASALGDPEFEFSDSESGDSDGNAVYEFTRDVRHGDCRDPIQPPPGADTPGRGLTQRRAQRRAASGEQGGLGRAWAAVGRKLRRIVDSKYFNRGIMMAILTNTLSMGVEYHEQVSVAAGPLPSAGLGTGISPSCVCWRWQLLVDLWAGGRPRWRWSPMLSVTGNCYQVLNKRSFLLLGLGLC